MSAQQQPPKVPTSDDAWDNGELGRSEEHARPLEEDIEKKIDEALELQLISIRLQKSLIEDFKSIAALNGLGYQPLMRQVLTRFVDCEKKRILREAALQMKEETANAKQRKVA